MKNEKLDSQLEQLIGQNAHQKALRIFVCSNINELFAADIDLGKTPWLKRLAEKIVLDYPRIYRLLCTMKINKIYARFVKGRGQKNG